MNTGISLRIILIAIISCTIECSSKGKVAMGPISKAIGNSRQMEQPPVYPSDTQGHSGAKHHRDSLQHRNTDTAKVRKVLMEPVKQLVTQQNTIPVDTLVKYNFMWQRLYMRLVDSNIRRRVQRDVALKDRDSALIVARHTERMVQTMQTRQGVDQVIGSSMRHISDTVWQYFIYWIGLVVTIQFVLSLFKKRPAI